MYLRSATRSLAAVLSVCLSVCLSGFPGSAAMAAPAPQGFADLAHQVSPAVVNITTRMKIEPGASAFPQLRHETPQSGPMNQLEDFLRQFMQNNMQPARPEPVRALGSGFIVSPDGYIVTNNHVVKDADSIMIELFSGKKLEASVIGVDPSTDIALLKVSSATQLPYVPLGDSEKMKVGDWVLAMGNPLGQGFSISAGIVSAEGRALGGQFDDYIQTDAAINKGNSGGPLFNMDGEVVGVNTAILSPDGGSIGIGFAMSSNVVKKVVGQIRTYGETRRGWLGVRIQSVTPDIAQSLGLKTPEGVLVAQVMDGPASRAGIKAGDVIVGVDGAATRTVRDLVNRIADSAVGKSVNVGLFRDGRKMTVRVVLAQRQDQSPGASAAEESPSGKAEPPMPATVSIFGMTMAEISPEIRTRMGLPDGAQGIVVIRVDPDGAASGKGVQAGDMVTRIATRDIAHLSDIETALKTAGSSGRAAVLLQLTRDGNPVFVGFPLTK